MQHQLASEGLRLLFAGFVVVLSTVELWRLRRGAVVAALPTRRRVATLLSAGVIHGLFATGGPLVVYALGREIEDKSAFRSTLAVLWILTSTVLLLDMVASGKVGWPQLELGVWMLLPMGLGMVLGGWVHQRVSQRLFREGVYALLIVVGMSLLVRAWLGA